MLTFVVWLILLWLFTGLALLLRYWIDLFRSREEYTRPEILDLATILQGEMGRLTPPGGKLHSLLSFAGGVLVVWFLALLGGLVSPDLSTTPDLAENHLPNYFFQSLLILPLLQLIWPLLKDLNRGNGPGPLSLFLKTELSLFFGAAVTLVALNFTLWGVYHQMSFLFVLLNSLASMGYLLYRLLHKKTWEEEEESEQTNEEPLYGADRESPDEEEETFPDDSGSVTAGAERQESESTGVSDTLEDLHDLDDLHDFGEPSALESDGSDSLFGNDSQEALPSSLEEDLLDFDSLDFGPDEEETKNK